MKGTAVFLSVIFFTNNVRSQETTLSSNIYRVKNIATADKSILSGNYYFTWKSNYPNPLLFNNKTKKYDTKKREDGTSKAKIFSNFFVKLYGSYGFLTPGSYSVQSTNNITFYDKNGDQHDTTIQSQGTKGIGGGFRFGVGIGYVLNDFLNFGIDAEYLIGAKLTNSLSSLSDSGYFYSSARDEMNYKAITLSPHIIFKALAKPKYFIYNKLGILLTLPYTLKTSGNSLSSWTYNWQPGVVDSSFKSSSNKNSTYAGKYKISLGIGFNVAFGVNFRVGNNLRAFGEIFGNFSALSPSSSQVVTTTNQSDSIYRNNQLALVSNTTYSTGNTIYQKEGLTTNHLIKDIQVPGGRTLTYAAQDKKFTVNMNVMGTNAGIIYRF